MTWKKSLEGDLIEAVRARPFAARAVIAPTSFAAHTLRQQLMLALAAEGLPLAGVSIVSAAAAPLRLFPGLVNLRSPALTRLVLLEHFTRAGPALLGGSNQRPWRDQLRLAATLLDHDLEGLDPSVLTASARARPRLAAFIGAVQAAVGEVDGRSPLSAAEAAPSPKLRAWRLPLPPLPLRLQTIIDRLDAEELTSAACTEGQVHRERSPEALSRAAIAGLAQRRPKNAAVLVLDPALEGPIIRALDEAQLVWRSPQPRHAGFNAERVFLRQHPLANNHQVGNADAWGQELCTGAPAAVVAAASDLSAYGALRIPAGAVVDEVDRILARSEAKRGWPGGSIDLLSAGSWPDRCYDEVLILGAQRGRTAASLNQRAPLLTPADRRFLVGLGFNTFDADEVADIEGRWLRAWGAASRSMVLGWVTHNAAANPLFPDRWALELGRSLADAERLPPRRQRQPPEPARTTTFGGLAPRRWSPSSVRKLIGCPRDYLLGRELRLESDDEPEGLKRLSDARWRGTQLHAIAAKACSRIVQGHADLEDLPEELAEACSTILNDMDPPFPTAILPAVRSDFLARLAVITAQFREGAFTALLGVEQTIHTTLDDGIELSAKYDLLVEGRDGELMVIDLKSGATRDNQYLTRSEEREGEIQRGAYLLCEPKAEAACLLYLNPGPNMLVPTSRDSGRAGWASLTTQTADQLRRDGVFAPTGEVDRRCTTCAMRFACRPWDAVWRGSIGGRAAVLDQQRAEAVEDTR